MIDNSPLFGPNENKSTSLTIKITPSQKEWLCETAKQKGFNTSQFVHYLISLGCEQIKRNEQITDEEKLRKFFPNG